MSLDLKDLRLKITPETHCWLEAESRATGLEKHQIVRDLLHHKALETISRSDLLQALLITEGLRRQ